MLKKAELTLSTGPKLDCSTTTLRNQKFDYNTLTLCHLQCRNLAAMPEIYVNYSVETSLHHLNSTSSTVPKPDCSTSTLSN